MEKIKKKLLLLKFSDPEKCLKYINSHSSMEELFWKNSYGLIQEYESTKNDEVWLTITSLKNAKPISNMNGQEYAFAVRLNSADSIALISTIEAAIDAFEKTIINSYNHEVSINERFFCGTKNCSTQRTGGYHYVISC